MAVLITADLLTIKGGSCWFKSHHSKHNHPSPHTPLLNFKNFLKMRFEVVCLLVLAAVYASAIEPSKKNDERFLIGTGSYSFTTFTILKYTTTTTSTYTSVTTCTTSTTTLSTCTPSARKRRGLLYTAGEKQDRARRGLFYNEDEAEEKDGSIFLPAAPVDNK